MGTIIQRGLPCKWCSSSDAMAEYDTNWKCFSCGKSESKKRKTKMKKGLVERGLNPFQRYEELPSNVKAYLYKYHFTDELIEKYKLSWAPNFQVWSKRKQEYFNSGDRIILPYYANAGTDAEKFVFCEAKSLDHTNKLKYVSVNGKKDLFLSESLKCSQYSPQYVVIVEDMLSAMRVGEVCPALALRGTKIDYSKYLDIINSAPNGIIIWLDNDKAGRAACKTLKNKLQWIRSAKVVRSDKDPKCYSNEKIREFIENAC